MIPHALLRSGFSVLPVLLLTAALGLTDTRRLDDGLLDPDWFGVAEGWRTRSGIDYFWMKPGFTLESRTIELASWPDPLFLNGKRDAQDGRTAYRLTDSMPGRLERALSPALAGRAQVSRRKGDVRLIGRFVDLNAGAPSWAEPNYANATWDLKLVDAATGETLAAFHHRGVSGLDTLNLSEKVNRWLTRRLAPALREGYEVWASAEPVEGAVASSTLPR